MPLYCYRCDDIVYEARFPFGEAPETIEVRSADGLIFAERDLQSEFATHSISVKKGSGNVRKTWPLECYGSGVNADQAPELRKHFKEHGLGVEVSQDGNPIYTSAAQRKRALKCRGMHDRNSFC